MLKLKYSQKQRARIVLYYIYKDVNVNRRVRAIEKTAASIDKIRFS